MTEPYWRVLTRQLYEGPQTQTKPHCTDDDGFPFEFHIPGYRFCGPGTKYLRNINYEISPSNELDAACMNHDAIYTYQCRDIDARWNADKRLLGISSKRIISADASFKERASAVLVTAILSIKMALQSIGSRIINLFN